MREKKIKTGSDRLYIKVYDGQIETALRKLKRNIKENNLMIELKKRSFFEKKSTKRRREVNLAKQRGKRLINT